MKNNEVKLGRFKRWVLNWSFSLVEMLIGGIKDAPTKALLQAGFIPIKDIVNVVTDNVPDNNIQLKELIENKGGSYAAGLVRALIVLVTESKKIKDSHKEFLLNGLNSLAFELETVL